MSRAAREQMVAQQLLGRGLVDDAVLQAMRAVPREHFVPASLREAAFEDRALPLTDGQTISQPYMVAQACHLARVRPGARVLDVGTGSGYQAAVLAALGAEVISIERVASLAHGASARLKELGYAVRVVVGDGSIGFVEGAPYDAVVCAAAAPSLPEAWFEQLAVGGRAVVPIGTRTLQRLTVVERGPADQRHTEVYDRCLYVPLLGAEGFGE